MHNEKPATFETPATPARVFPPGGAAPAQVVLVHGAPDRARSFNAAVRALPEYLVTTYDRRGYGQRAGHPPPPTGDIFEHAEDLIGLLEETPAVVVGHSFGGIVAMAASIKAPELIPAVGVWEPPLIWTPWWPDDHMQEATAWLAASRDVFRLGELSRASGNGRTSVASVISRAAIELQIRRTFPAARHAVDPAPAVRARLRAGTDAGGVRFGGQRGLRPRRSPSGVVSLGGALRCAEGTPLRPQSATGDLCRFRATRRGTRYMIAQHSSFSLRVASSARRKPSMSSEVMGRLSTPITLKGKSK